MDEIKLDVNKLFLECVNMVLDARNVNLSKHDKALVELRGQLDDAMNEVEKAKAKADEESKNAVYWYERALKAEKQMEDKNAYVQGV